MLNLRSADVATSHPEQLIPGSMDRLLPAALRTRRYMYFAGGALALIVSFALLFSRYGRADVHVIDKGQLSISTAYQTLFQESLPLIGTLSPVETVFVDIDEPGQVAEVLAQPGDMVKQAQVLLRLISNRPETELMNSENLLAQQLNQLSSIKFQYEQSRLNTERMIIDLRAALDKLKANHQRLLKLKDTGAVRQADLDDEDVEINRQEQSLAALERSLALSDSEGRKQIDTLQTVVNRLNAKLDLARDNLDSLKIRAPIAGQLTSFTVHIGERLNPSQHVGRIDQLEQNKLVTEIDEYYLNRVKAGQTARATIADTDYALSVVKVYPEVRDHHFIVDLKFTDASPVNTHIGQTMPVRLQISASSPALVIGNGSFYESANQGVFVLRPDGHSAERRKISLGRRNADQVEILAGVDAGEQVIVSSYQSFNGFNVLRFK